MSDKNYNQVPLLIDSVVGDRKKKSGIEFFSDFFNIIKLRLKKKSEDYETIPLENVFETIFNLQGGYSIEKNTKNKLGLFYDDSDVIPNEVSFKKNGDVKSLDIDFMVLHLIEAVKELKLENMELYERIEALEKQESLE
jgi:hypothetical protein